MSSFRALLCYLLCKFTELFLKISIEDECATQSLLKIFPTFRIVVVNSTPKNGAGRIAFPDRTEMVLPQLELADDSSEK